jgi:hypothetical protein
VSVTTEHPNGSSAGVLSSVDYRSPYPTLTSPSSVDGAKHPTHGGFADQNSPADILPPGVVRPPCASSVSLTLTQVGSPIGAVVLPPSLLLS